MLIERAPASRLLTRNGMSRCLHRHLGLGNGAQPPDEWAGKNARTASQLPEKRIFPSAHTVIRFALTISTIRPADCMVFKIFAADDAAHTVPACRKRSNVSKAQNWRPPVSSAGAATEGNRRSVGSLFCISAVNRIRHGKERRTPPSWIF